MSFDIDALQSTAVQMPVDAQTRAFLHAFLPVLGTTFGDRIWFCGLQGSRARKENTPDSDIDMVVILYSLDVADVQTYRQILAGIPDANLACGFLSGKQELLDWDPAELFQFCHDTLPIIGTLHDVAAQVRKEDVLRYVRNGAGTIYHGVIHNMLYERSGDALAALYKSAGFLLTAMAWCNTGTYAGNALHFLLSDPDDLAVLDTCRRIRAGKEVPFDEASALLFRWSDALLPSFARLLSREKVKEECTLE